MARTATSASKPILSTTRQAIGARKLGLSAARSAADPQKGAFFTTKIPPENDLGAISGAEIALNAAGTGVGSKTLPSVLLARDFDQKTRAQCYWQPILAAKKTASSMSDGANEREKRLGTAQNAVNGWVSAPSPTQPNHLYLLKNNDLTPKWWGLPDLCAGRTRSPGARVRRAHAGKRELRINPTNPTTVDTSRPQPPVRRHKKRRSGGGPGRPESLR